MADRSIVLDANILIRAILGRRVGELIERYSAQVGLYAPDTAFLEVEEHLPRICEKAGMPLNKAMAAYQKLAAHVQELPTPAYSAYEVEARGRIDLRDPDDWPVLASALALDCPVWTEDNDFFGAGVPTWTTDRVERYFAEPPSAAFEATQEAQETPPPS